MTEQQQREARERLEKVRVFQTTGPSVLNSLEADHRLALDALDRVRAAIAPWQGSNASAALLADLVRVAVNGPDA